MCLLLRFFMSCTFNIKHVPYNLRDNQILTLPNFKNIIYGKISYKYYGAHVWNHIPVEIKAANITTYKKRSGRGKVRGVNVICITL